MENRLFHPGGPGGPGRPKGSVRPNLSIRLKESGCDPIAEMVRIAGDRDDPNYFKAVEFLAKRVEPERKSVDAYGDTSDRVEIIVKTNVDPADGQEADS